ncbi:MAG: OmpH family outer membrane protein [Bacteroides sp.]|jgi:outer membrane protein|nr:OmpH family outer membrane protein [Bacteroides sp.]
MKKTALFTIMILLAGMSFGQRFAYIDSDYIMENIPEYKAAEQELEQISVSWQTEIEQKFSEVDRLYREYQAEAPLLPEDMRRQREESIIEQERIAKELQMQRFGREGDLFKKRQELIKPIQDKIYEAIEEIATRGNYAVIFDKSGGMTMIFTDVRYDLSDEVLQRLGYRN